MSGHIRVLMVTEEDAGPLSQGASTLASEGLYDVDHANTLSGALRTFAARRPAVAILHLPRGEGLGLRTFRRFHSQSGDVPIIVVGAATNPAGVVALLHAGAVDYLLDEEVTGRRLNRSIQGAVESVARARKRRELDQIRADFVATASHELRTPLSIIREYVSIVHDGIVGALNDEQRECLDAARRNCDRLSDMIDGTLDLRRLETGSQRICRKKTDPDSILRPCARDFEPQVRKKNQTLRVNIAEKLPPILGSSAALTQVVVNLLGNATKFTPSGGEIVLRAFQEGEKVRFEVEDSGIGIPPTDQARIFEKFARVGDESVLGSGLGLAITRQLVEAHQGAVGVDSQLGHGSTFWFTIPCYSEHDELEAFIGDAAQAVHEDDERRLSVTLVRPHVGRNGDRAPRSRILSELRKIDGAISGTLRRRGDATLVVAQMGVVAIAAEVEDDGVAALCERIQRTVLQSVGTSVPISFASAVRDPNKPLSAFLSALETGLEDRAVAGCDCATPGFVSNSA